jgi:hypothetical protein
MSRARKERGHGIGRLVAALACAALGLAVLPASAPATVISWGPITFANRSLDVGVGYGNGTSVKGSMTKVDNDPAAGDQVAGAPLCQLELVRNGPNPENQVLYKEPVCVSVPPGQGQFDFEFEVSPGPSRELIYWYLEGGIHGWPGELHFNVAFRPQLFPQERVVRNGERVKFVGAIPAFPPVPTMRLQVRTGKKWRTFKILTVGNDGSYVGVYRFTNTNRRQKYFFRVKPIPNGSYPIVLSPSPKAKVIVKP